MLVKLNYENDQNLAIESMSVIGPFNGFDPQRNVMQLLDNSWQTEIDFPSGEHSYKYLINGEIKLNDPMANVYYPDDKEELWSLIIINEQNQRLYNNEQYTVNVEGYALTNSINELPVAISKHSFNNTTDRKAVARFEFNHITGLHAVTAVWYDSHGEVYEFAENNLYSDEELENQSVYLWFWLDLNDGEKECQEGVYTLKLFIDGSYILEDEIKVMRAITYSPNGYYNSYR